MNWRIHSSAQHVGRGTYGSWLSSEVGFALSTTSFIWNTRKMIWLRQKSKWIVARKIPYGAASYRMMDYHPLAKKCGIVCCSSSRKHLRTRTEDSLFWDRERSRTSLYTTYAHTDYSTHIYLSHIGKEHVPTNRNRSSGIMTCTICDAHKPTPQYEETYLVKSSRTRATSITWLNRPTELTKVLQIYGCTYVNKYIYRAMRELG